MEELFKHVLASDYGEISLTMAGFALLFWRLQELIRHVRRQNGRIGKLETLHDVQQDAFKEIKGDIKDLEAKT